MEPSRIKQVRCLHRITPKIIGVALLLCGCKAAEPTVVATNTAESHVTNVNNADTIIYRDSTFVYHCNDTIYYNTVKEVMRTIVREKVDTATAIAVAEVKESARAPYIYDLWEPPKIPRWRDILIWVVAIVAIGCYIHHEKHSGS